MSPREADRLRAEFVSAFRELEDVPASVVDRGWRDIERRVGQRRTIRRALGIVAAIAAVAVVAVGWSLRPSPRVDPLVALRPPAANVWRSSTMPAPLHLALPSSVRSPASVEPSPRIAEPSEALPEAASPGSVRSHRVGVASRRHENPLETRAERRERPSTLAEETQAYREIRRALRVGQAATALTLLDAYARRFPEGVYRDESELARVRALCMVHRTAQARAVIERQRNRHLASELRAILQSACAAEGERR